MRDELDSKYRCSRVTSSPAFCQKRSTKRSYECELRVHILPALAGMRITDVAPLHIEKLLQSRLEGGSSPKTVRNLVGLLQSIFSLPVDNDLIPRSPVRDLHKPTVTRHEKPVWTAEQLKQIVGSVPRPHRSLFQCAMLTGARRRNARTPVEAHQLSITNDPAGSVGRQASLTENGGKREGDVFRPIPFVCFDRAEEELQPYRPGGLRLLQGRWCAAQPGRAKTGCALSHLGSSRDCPHQ